MNSRQRKDVEPLDTKSAYVVSDLHMFCQRSLGHTLLDTIDDVARNADLFVFNGDTFDFKWTVLGSVEETVDRAVEFLGGLARRRPNCHFHVNLGNHDRSRGFVERLDVLARKTPNLTWHPYYLRVGSTLFLHGDVAMWKLSQLGFEPYRARRRQHKKRGRFRNRMYDALVRTGAHVTVSRLANPSRWTARKMAAYLEDIGHGPEEGVEQVYFGHTHVAMSNYCYRGITYHNTGAAFKGMRCVLLKAKI